MAESTRRSGFPLRATVALTVALLVPTLAAAAQGHEADGGGVLDPILKTLNLFLFFGLIVYFVARPIGKALRERRERIDGDHAEANRKLAIAARTEEEIREKVAALEAEVEAFGEKARQDGEREKAELVARSTEEADRVVAQARAEVASQVELARRELAAYAGRLATELAAKKVEGDLDPALRAAFLDRAIDELERGERAGEEESR